MSDPYKRARWAQEVLDAANPEEPPWGPGPMEVEAAVDILEWYEGKHGQERKNRDSRERS
jgi:hypothetical protein